MEDTSRIEKWKGDKDTTRQVNHTFIYTGLIFLSINDVIIKVTYFHLQLQKPNYINILVSTRFSFQFLLLHQYHKYYTLGLPSLAIG